MVNFLKYYLPILLCWLFVIACGGNNQHDQNVGVVELPGENHVLVKVNGSQVTEYDLNEKLRSLSAEVQASLLDEQSRKKVLESMVMSRVIAQAAEKQLSAQERKILDKRLQSQREILLTNYYLKNHSNFQPVTEQMIKAYYDAHPENYGGRSLRKYEMLFGDKKTDPAGRQKIIAALQKASGLKNWQALAAQTKKQGIDLSYRAGASDESILAEPLKTLISGTKPGETSQLTFIKSKPYIVRITGEQQQPARPLQEVSAEIRKTLIPLQLKKSIDQVSEELMKSADIEYTK